LLKKFGGEGGAIVRRNGKDRELRVIIGNRKKPPSP